MATIQTATGPLDTAELGFTLMHEHVLVTDPAYRFQHPERWDREAQLENAVRRLREARAAGVRTMVDLTPIDLGRDAAFIRDAAAGSGMQIVVPTGFYYQIPFHYVGRPSEQLVAAMVTDIRDGIGNTGVRAGVIKCATEPAMHRMNERVLRASARAHRETGAPICTHTFPENRTGLEQIRVFKDEGVDLGRVVIGHSDDSNDIGYLESIIGAGAYCGMDRFGIQRPRTTAERAEMVVRLVERGYAERITLSHDASCYIDFFTEGVAEERIPEWRFTHIIEDVIPMLRERGVSEAAIQQMTVGNPRRIFEQTEPY
ncbi:MAG: phosphotriesterase [Chloroflexi bacterium]|nr:phosphotriesterase [Chloroflexota bacterium]